MLVGCPSIAVQHWRTPRRKSLMLPRNSPGLFKLHFSLPQAPSRNQIVGSYNLLRSGSCLRKSARLRGLLRFKAKGRVEIVTRDPGRGTHAGGRGFSPDLPLAPLVPSEGELLVTHPPPGRFLVRLAFPIPRCIDFYRKRS